MKEMSFMKEIRLTREKIALLLIILFSAVMNLANLSIQGYGNEYYAAGVKSMTMSWSNFFFVAFDPAGFVTIDKPPLGFWIQALSAKLFGYSGWSILLPQALAGVLSVYVLYCVVKKTFGSTAALISAFCLATTPIFVAVSKNNTLDSMLVLTLLLASLVLTKAIETGKFKYLILSLAIVGIGFNVKMLQAYMVLPAFYLTYLLSATIPVKKRLLQLVAGTLVLAVVSLSWAVIVDLVPATNRPYVGSSTNNSELELIFGHNGLERLTGSSGGGMGMQQGGGQGQVPENMPAGDQQLSSQDGQGFPEGVDAPAMGDGEMTMAAGYAPSGDGPSGMNSGDQDERGGGNRGNNNSTFGGSEPASIVRLFSNNGLTDQISWLLPLAIIGLIAAYLNQKRKTAFDPKIKQGLLLWTLWLIPVFIYFSFTTGLFHPYYLVMLAPPIAALTGIGLVSLGELYQQEDWQSWLLPIGLVVSGLIQLLMLSYYYSTSLITLYLMIITGVLWGGAALNLVFLKLFKGANLTPDKKKQWQTILVGVAFLGLVITPTAWAGTTVFYKMSGTFPSAGLALTNSDSMAMGMSSATTSETDNSEALVNYLKANSSDEKYLLAVPSATGYAAKIIIESGESVMAIGGFSGSDNILTLDEFKTMVTNGEIRYAMINGGGGGGSNEISAWIKENGQAITASEWSGTTTSTTTQNANNGMMGGGSEQLYDLQQE